MVVMLLGNGRLERAPDLSLLAHIAV